MLEAPQRRREPAMRAAVVAAARGWRVHLFTSWQGWAERLVAEGALDSRPWLDHGRWPMRMPLGTNLA